MPRRPTIRVVYMSAAGSPFRGRYFVDCSACGYVGHSHATKGGAAGDARIHKRAHANAAKRP